MTEQNKMVSRKKMGLVAMTFHGFMTLCTAGLWLFVIPLFRRGRKTVTTFK